MGSVQLVTLDSLESPNIIEWLVVQLDRVVRFFEGEPRTAEQRVYATMPDPLTLDGWGA